MVNGDLKTIDTQRHTEGISESANSVGQEIHAGRDRLRLVLKNDAERKKFFSYLFNRFNLKKKDISADILNKIADLISVTKDMKREIDKFILNPENIEILIIGINDYLNNKFNIRFSDLSRKSKEDIIQYTREQLGNNPRLQIAEALINNKNILQLILVERIDSASECEQCREQVISEIERQYPFTKEWDNNDISEEKLGNTFFCPRDKQFLSTYFDTATFGLTNISLGEEAKMIGGSAYLDFNRFIGFQKKTILNYFEPKKEKQPYRFSEDNMHFFSSASDAFRQFAQNYLKPGDTVLISNEEYYGLIADMRSLGVHVETLDDYKDNNEYYEKILHKLSANPPKYILASEISRRGSLLPLSLFRNAIEETGAKTSLIVDGTQAIGRKETDFHEFNPDIYFASCQKGSDMGGPSAVLMLSDDFVEKNTVKITPPKGTENTIAIKKFAMACNTNDVKKRQKRLQDLSLKFLQIIGAINEINDRRIIIHYPKTDDPDKLTGIFELEVEGVTRRDIENFGRKYGIFIAYHYADPINQKYSFRIAFHPHMNDNSVKILAHILDQASKNPNKESGKQ